jgi:DUF971 family protein
LGQEIVVGILEERFLLRFVIVVGVQMNSSYPTSLSRLDDKRLQIMWSSGENRVYQIAELRSKCPCATCREKRNAQAKEPPPLFEILKPAEAQPLTLAGMRPVGNYAYAIAFSDGHDTGIYTFELLQELGDSVEQATP